MNFCRECNNLLYPREDRINKRLLYACRNCTYSEAAKANCVYTNEIKQSINSNLLVSKETSLDPTLKRTKAIQCNQCGWSEAVFFARSDERMELIFMCTNTDCNHCWVQGEK
jgi:DNA-directed RNA polymerase II subunit RPB9